MDPVWTLRRESSFLLSDLHWLQRLLKRQVLSQDQDQTSHITHHTWSRLTKKSYFCLIFLCMPLSLAWEYSRFSLLLTSKDLSPCPSRRGARRNSCIRRLLLSGPSNSFLTTSLTFFNRNRVILVVNPLNYANVRREFGCSRRIELLHFASKDVTFRVNFTFRVKSCYISR